MKNILVTGGTGYIGSITCIRLIENGLHPVIIDNLCNSKAVVLDRIETLTGVRPTFYEGDIRDEALLDTMFAEQNIDAVIHFAGLKAVGESVEKPMEYYDNNVSGSLVLARAMRRANVKTIIFSSSATVYGENNPIPYVENMPTGGTTSPYGTSKYMIERMLMDFYAADNNWSVTLLRYFNPVGAHPSGTMGEDPQGIPNNLVPFIAQVAVGRRDKLAVFGDDYPTKDGTGVRDYIHVMDLADGHVVALQKKYQQSGVHIYNLGSGQGTSVLEMIKAFEGACGHDIAYDIKPRRAGDIAEFYAGTEKAEKELGWTTRLTITDMMRDTWKWQSQYPNGYDS